MATTVVMQQAIKQVLSISAFILCSGLANAQSDRTPTSVSQGMVVTANPIATQVGADIIRRGGSAVDAAVAIESVLSLVEPQSSGLGGGGYMVYFDNNTKSVTSYDGRETAPSRMPDDVFLTTTGKRMGYFDAKNSGLSIGVPGMVAMLAMAHNDHGNLQWKSLFKPAIGLAEDGFEISPRLHNFLTRFKKYIPSKPSQGPTDAYEYFYAPSGQPYAVGYKLSNFDYMETLYSVAKDPANFYRGEIAASIVSQAATPPRQGYLKKDDLTAYKPIRKTALCTSYKRNTLCGPPPSSSWIAVGMIMRMLENGPAFSERGAHDAANWSMFADAQRLAYADRDLYVADPEFSYTPIKGLLNSTYLYDRAKHISSKNTFPKVEAGDPTVYEKQQANNYYGADGTVDMAGTSHFVVVDLQGNVVSMTASVESIFGSTRMAGGMFLNNQLTDFSFHSKDSQGTPIANRIEGGKRPRSSMSPTIVLDENGEFLMATGSPGGNSIIAYTSKTMIGILEWGLSPKQAIELPNMVARGDVVKIEQSRATPELIAGLRDAGYTVKESSGENSGISVIYRSRAGLEGAADPRREGTVAIINSTDVRKPITP